MASALEEASDCILSELDVVGMFSAPAEDPWLIGDAINDFLELVIVATSATNAAILRVRLRIIGHCCNFDSTVHNYVKRFSDQMDNFGKAAYEYVEECLKLRVLLLAMSL